MTILQRKDKVNASMKCQTETLLTPVHIKMYAGMPWPEDRVFYLLTGSGLFVCRNYPFFRSCTPAKDWPSELAFHEPSFEPRFPIIGRKLMQEIVGFFDEVTALHRAEAAVLLGWDAAARKVEPIVPPQVATVERTASGHVYPVGLHYELPEALPESVTLFGDIHSHGLCRAYASWVDKDDEAHRTGLHIVVGRIDEEPPEFHVEAVADGTRFALRRDQAFEGYKERSRQFPAEWLDQVTVETER